MFTWEKIRTCSGTSSGLCSQCKQETYCGAYFNGVEIRCPDCYEAEFEPERLAARAKEWYQAQQQKQERLEKALKGELPGAIVEDNGTVLGPLVKMWGLPYREVLRVGTFDSEKLKNVSPWPYLSHDFYKKESH